MEHVLPPATGLLDPAPLEDMIEIFGEDGPAIVYEIVETFLSESPELVTRVDLGVESRNLVAIRDGTHTLKSSAGNVGATALANLCQCIESAARNSDHVTAIELCPGVRTLFEQTAESLRHWLALRRVG